MKLLDSLLDAIVRLEGDALVMHVGEKPYVITASASMNAYRGPLAWGQVELSSRVLTFDAVSSMLAQILPADQQRALEEFGAVEHEILPPDGILDRFTVIAARGGEDVWVEVRRKPVPAAVPDVVPQPEVPSAAEADSSPEAASVTPAAAAAEAQPDTEAPPAQAVLEPQAPPEPVALQQPGPPAPEPEQQAPPPPELESIVVALPGQDSEEVQLGDVADNAIQVVDDEPQGVPTEEEVDAMLAATAGALLTSGLSIDEEVVDLPAEPEFQLSPPAEIVEESPSEAVEEEPRAETPAGAPLFSEAAEAAAAPPPPEIVSEPAPELEVRPEPLTGPEPVAAAAMPEPQAVPAAADTEAAAEDEATITVSDEPEITDVLVGSIEITPEAVSVVSIEREVPVPAAEPVPAVASVNELNAGVEPAAAEPVPLAQHSAAAEMPMDPTPESRYAERAGDRSLSSPLSAGPPASPPSGEAGTSGPADDDGRQGVVVPMSRPLKPEVVTTPFTPSEDAALMHTLRAAAARGAGTVYVVAQSKPMIRIDGDIMPLESEAVLTAADVERLVLELAPPRKREAFQTGPVEWLCDVPEIGRVRCLTFRDHRGPGVLFRMFPPRAISADQLGLTPEVQALCQQPDGLVLVTGARASGKSTLLNAFVDLINRTRSDHVITVETQIGFVHESRRSFISQRETRGDAEFAASVARAALREDPDVMMIEELKSPELVATALEAADSGRLVLASVPAASTIAALERLLEVFPADRRPKARASLATSLRGVIAQVLLRKVTGGRVAAREILLNTPAVSTLLLEGKMFQLPVALDSGRRLGMMPLTDSLAGFVRDGTVHPGEAYRKALDRAALVATLKRDGFDTSFAERMV